MFLINFFLYLFRGPLVYQFSNCQMLPSPIKSTLLSTLLFFFFFAENGKVTEYTKDYKFAAIVLICNPFVSRPIAVVVFLNSRQHALFCSFTFCGFVSNISHRDKSDFKIDYLFPL